MLKSTIQNFKNNITRYIDLVTKNFETLFINEGSNSGIVVMSKQEYGLLTDKSKKSINASAQSKLKENGSSIGPLLERYLSDQ